MCPLVRLDKISDKITIYLHIFTYTCLEIYTPSSAFSPIFHFRSLYPNRYKTSCNITLILHNFRPFQVLSVALAKQFPLSLYCWRYHYQVLPLLLFMLLNQLLLDMWLKKTYTPHEN